jgi:hypothetical protein
MDVATRSYVANKLPEEGIVVPKQVEIAI